MWAHFAETEGTQRTTNEQPSHTETKITYPVRVKPICLKMETVLALSAMISPEVEKKIGWLQSKGLLSPN